jgi:replication factor C subunit 1
MDEVDGMSAGDRGGGKELIDTIKTTKTPIVCICNDRMHPKVRSLANHCYDIRFHKPQKGQVAKRVAEICASEKMRVDLNSLEYLCESFGNDIRQILNFLQMYSKRADTLTYMDAKNTLNKSKKDETVMMNNFDAAKKLMTVRILLIIH